MTKVFPAIPPDPFWRMDAASAHPLLTALDAWRDEAVASLRTEADDAISPTMRATLLELLGADPGESFRKLPYRLTRYPDPATRTGDPVERLQQVLLWRAGIVDFLSDAWDTLGESTFGIEECNRVSRLFTPEGTPGRERCVLCFAEFADRPAKARHFELCPVQLAWRDARSSHER